MTNPPSTAPDGATADSGVKVEAPFPGPWRVVPYGDGDSLVIHTANGDSRVCFMSTPGDSPRAWATIQASAHLIAAAPDLLEALGGDLEPGEQTTCGPLAWLRSAIDTLRDKDVCDVACGEDPDAYFHMIGELETLEQRARAAIAKAEGRS